MGFPNIARVIDRLTEIGAIDEGTKKIVNHFSHNGNPMQDYLEACASPLGCAVSYDGLTVEI
jgi:phosphoribosyl 1,2-cyclic phosphate phosphodiesterase